MSDGKGPQFRMRHVMLRVLDLEKSIDFYTRHLGMKVQRRKQSEIGRFAIAFIGYGDEADHTVLELIHNWDQQEPYEPGNGFGHVAIGVTDIHAACEEMEKNGVRILRPPGPMMYGGPVMAFIEDPDGYLIELLEGQ